MSEKPSTGKTNLITGAARRLGHIFALACANAGANVVIHHGHSEADAESLASEISALGRQTLIFLAYLSDSDSTRNLIQQINRSAPLHGPINNAAIFESLTFASTSIEDWNKHLASTTKSLAVAPGAIIPPADRNKNPDIIKNVPILLQRWAQTGEVEEALLFAYLPRLHHGRNYPR